MPSKPRMYQQNGFYHLYNRGNHRQLIFGDDFDRQLFLSRAQDYAKKYNVSILAFCLMRNHYHILVRQKSDNNTSVKAFISGLVMSYTRYFNIRYRQVGTLFQDKYKSKPVTSDTYLIWLTYYIHNNPSSFTDPLSYPWSSIQNYLHNTVGLADPRYILQCLNGQTYRLENSEFFSTDQLRVVPPQINSELPI